MAVTQQQVAGQGFGGGGSTPTSSCITGQGPGCGSTGFSFSVGPGILQQPAPAAGFAPYLPAPSSGPSSELGFGFGTGTTGVQSSNVSGPSGGFGSAPSSGVSGPSGGFGGFGSAPSSNVPVPSGGFGGFGSAPSSTAPSGGFGSAPSSGVSGPSGGFGSAPSSNVPVPSGGFGGFGSAPSSTAPSGGFGSAPPSNVPVSSGGFGGFGSAPSSTAPSGGSGSATTSNSFSGFGGFGGFGAAVLSGKKVDYPTGILCVDYINGTCKKPDCPHAHRYTFSTTFSFADQFTWFTIDLNTMCQVSHATGNTRQIRQGKTRWEYVNDHGLYTEYHPKDDATIRQRLSNGRTAIDCEKLMTPTEAGRVGWEDGRTVVKMPHHWKERVLLDLPMEMVMLDENSEEYTAVKRTMERTGKVEVASVVRVQNYDLMTQYMLRKHQKEAQRGAAVEEKMLFHGTGIDNISKILTHGFDATLSSTGGLCGTGSYFATTSQYSTSYTEQHSDGTASMFLCRVLTGKPQARRTVSGTIRRPSEGCDSVIDNDINPMMYVVYYNNEAVPEYLVNFKVL